MFYLLVIYWIAINSQDIKFEQILIDNNRQKFICAADALNYGAKKSKGDILIFCHQDIHLKTEHELRDFCESVNKSDVGDIIGTQGVRERSKIYYTNITAGKEYISNIVTDYHLNLIKVSCIDEGFFGMKRETWKQHPFDAKLCDNWHLYAVEVCLNARKMNHNVYVYPIQLHHYSYGTISQSYMTNLKKICSYYRNDFKYIWTTCYKVRTSNIYINTLIAIWSLTRKLRRKLK